ncbi:MAG TPA: tRNA uridine-5-carboxymethylaminomethyl(34) synthesis enzyme MnmG [Firmicutes bacterium]|jgi:tRNA uridine 5-carboxymethylaminomethyl modification enzyme|nr:tRNA uridine-5-carboxymethylaminomethyl(34) synthesis enzyme MnmG [Bacillota bacterium]HBK67290.1 tRNA uridine-5-carboxymethylaminomethyl(34) synthesis enzyme MnmG [Bacillota bacterium]HBT16650.1 tRNA uridine-5-carboxymethylaminomethyl(34) synthesis enzyme MnmG [Bacillota bacterium]
MKKNYDVAVIGAGHAGCEAANAVAKMGFTTLLLTLNFNNIAFMPCNPSVGGPGKGNLVREIDALGGLIGRNTDQSHLQMRALNTQKGPAVRALRAQTDKHLYQQLMQYYLERQPLISIRQGEVSMLKRIKNHWRVTLNTGVCYEVPVVIIATGTFLRGKVHVGLLSYSSGPQGQHPSIALAENLEAQGIRFKRFKTGTPARVRKRSLDFSRMIEQPGDGVTHGFSHWLPWEPKKPISCWLTYTNEKTHQIIKNNLHLAPMYCGAITGIGTRYCPSIEGKVVTFPQRDRHQVFIEPEGLNTDEMYVAGLSSSLPEEIQDEFMRTVPGLEEVEMVRPGYAIEYDVVAPDQLLTSLQIREWPGLFCAGQINGTSGYEEAAAQGIVAGINAGLYLKGEEPFVLQRNEAYIGVLIDDLVTKENNEPYRIMTSRAEFRLSLRQENADLRLADYGYKFKLLSDQEYQTFMEKKEKINNKLSFLETTYLLPGSVEADQLKKETGVDILQKTSLRQSLKMPEIQLTVLWKTFNQQSNQTTEEDEVVENLIKYQGYLEREAKMAERLQKTENKKIPSDFDYFSVPNLSFEAREKLNKFRPETMGQASRISGVSPADLSALLIWMTRSRKK